MHCQKLAEQQGVDAITCEAIDHLHLVRAFIEEEASCPDTKKEKLLKLYDLWFLNEQTLQKLWKFKRDPNFIKFWAFPQCTCPKLDNEEKYPYGRYIASMDCIIHGNGES
jgi:hypothetical protein